MTTPLPAHAHVNAPAAERELTFDALFAEFGEVDDVQPQAPDAAVFDSAPRAVFGAAPRSRSPLARLLVMPSPEVLKLGGLIALAALSLTLMFVALAR